MDVLNNKRKIFNDPVFGFINIPDELTFDIIEHKYFQRLRRIKQLGFTELVYPGAMHTRFHHALGAMHLATDSIDVLRSKELEISPEEAQGLTIAILLHDIGHGPFSHALEKSIVYDMTHEDLSELFMNKLNKIFGDKLNIAIQIFKNTYHKKFLHQLVSSQLDLDRIDYLKRDSFYTGVSEGAVNAERIIKMLNVVDDNLVVESKGIYSIENFIIARRLMYWQVYLHKTVIVAENMLIKTLQRAKYISQKEGGIIATPNLDLFINNHYNKTDFIANPDLLDKFSELDDYDIVSSIKLWKSHSDKVLSGLCKRLLQRNLFKIELRNEPYTPEYIESIKENFRRNSDYSDEEIDFYVFSDKTTNFAYDPGSDKINILFKNNEIVDVALASDHLNISTLSETVTKYFVCYPKENYSH